MNTTPRDLQTLETKAYAGINTDREAREKVLKNII